MKASPQNPYFYEILGRLSELNKDNQKAEMNYKKAVEINPKVAGFYVSLAGFYVRQNLTDNALEECNTGIQKDPNAIWAPWHNKYLSMENE